MTDTFRKQYRELSADEKLRLALLKDQAEQMWHTIDTAVSAGADNRALSLAKTRLEEAVMWAVKGMT